jgi:phosphoribosyl-ATP pyrophosphohydrolase/phosphoribosyl-AMP cyclohydrolase
MNLDFNKNKDGLVPAIIQDNTTHKVLMLGYLSKESLSLTLRTMWFIFTVELNKEFGKKERKVVTN